jgi:hypothetical protein
MVTTKTHKGENVLEFSARIYGHATGVFWLLEDNPNLTITTEFAEATELITRDQKLRILELGDVVFTVKKLQDYKLHPRQGFFDVVVENQGHIEGAFPLVNVNNFDGFTEHLFEADVLTVLADSETPRLRDNLKPHMPVATVWDEDKSDGIGWMIIERNFIVR